MYSGVVGLSVSKEPIRYTEQHWFSPSHKGG